MLAWGMLAFPGGYAKAGNIGAGLGNVRWGSDYLLKTFTPDTTTNKGHFIVYQVLPLSQLPAHTLVAAVLPFCSIFLEACYCVTSSTLRELHMHSYGMQCC